MKTALSVLVVIMVAILAFQQFRIITIENKIEATVKQNKTLEDNLYKLTSNKEEEHYELAIAMGRQQMYMHKLYLAGDAQNWKLANFYAHELEETMEDIIEHNIVDEGHQISQLVKQMTFPTIEKIEKAIKGENHVQFVEGYELMLRSCNNCHVATSHKFIKIDKPKSSSFNQVFEKN